MSAPPVRSVWIDVDAVLADFHGRSIDLIEQRWGFRPAVSDFWSWDVTCVLELQEDKDEMNRMIESPGFATSLRPYPDAVRAVSIMRQAGVDLLFATAPHHHSATWMWERKKWLFREFDATEEEVAHIHKKHWIAADACIDDRVKTVERWGARHPGGRALLRRWRYNETATHLRSFVDWDDALRALGLA